MSQETEKIHSVIYGKDDGEGKSRLESAFGLSAKVNLNSDGFFEASFGHPKGEIEVRTALEENSLESGMRLSKSTENGWRQALVVGPLISIDNE